MNYVRKANTVLRAKISGKDVSVIPNAVDMSMFKPIKRGETGPPSDRGIIIQYSSLTEFKCKVIKLTVHIYCSGYNNFKSFGVPERS